MNTIPTTLDAGAVPYTVVGSPKPSLSGAAGSMSVVLLNRGSKLYRAEAIGELERAGVAAPKR